MILDIYPEIGYNACIQWEIAPMPWPANAYVGQKVVCVNDFTARPDLVKGRVYTIESINRQYFNLVGVSIQYAPRNGWLASRFRPVQSTDKGMAILRGLLKSTKVREDA